MKNIIFMLVTLFMVLGCGGVERTDDTLNAFSSKEYVATGEKTKITTKESSQNAVAIINDPKTFSSAIDLGGSNSNASPSAKYASSAYASSLNYSLNCSGGGSLSINGSGDSNNFNVISSYNECKEGSFNGYIIQNGQVSLSKTETAEQSKIAAEFKDFVIDSKVNEVSFNVLYNFYFEQSNSKENNDSEVYINGLIEQTAGTYKNYIGYEKFTSKLSNKNGQNEIELNGKISYDVGELSCSNGIFEIETEEPLVPSQSSGYQSGKMKINGVVIEYNSDNTATVTLTTGQEYTVSQNASVECGTF